MMNKILLVYEDYSDLMTVEAALKKVGFDVIGLSSEYAVTEQVLAFNPDLVVGAGRGGKVNSMGVGKRLKDMNRWGGRSVLIFPANYKPDPQELLRIRVDMVLEAPVPVFRLIQVIGKLLGHDEAVLLERFGKTGPVEGGSKPIVIPASGKFLTDAESIVIRGVVPAEEESDSLRSERIQNKDQSFPINNDDQSEKPKVSFRFGDRVSGTETSREADASEVSQGFADVDLKALEKELLGGGVPEVERVEVPFPALSEEDELTSIRHKAQVELKKSAESSAERVAKYKNIVADVKVPPISTVTRVEARRRQISLAADWDKENLKELDKLRREFVKGLFKK